MKAPSAKNKLHLSQLMTASPLFGNDNIYKSMIAEMDEYAIVLLNTRGIIKYWNIGAQKIEGYTAKEAMGKHFRIFYTPADQKNQLPENTLQAALKNGKAVFEGRRVRKDGTEFWASIVIYTIHDHRNKVIGFTKVTRDLTEKKNLEEAMLQAVVNAQEKERNEISNELHDNVSQILTTSKLLLEAASKECKNKFLEKGEENLQQALDEIRHLSHRLNPNAVMILGLGEAARDLVSHLRMLKQLKISFSCRIGKLSMPPEMQLSVFRILQEQVNNIMKHSGATYMRIELSEQRKKLCLLVADNGKGFQLNQVKKGLGLQNIFYRAELFKGSANIISSPGKGCIFKVELPLA